LPEGGKEVLGCGIDSLWTDRAVDFLKTPQKGPFFLGVSLHNPHDICYWIMNKHVDYITRDLKTDDASLPPLPDNFEIDPEESEIVRYRRTVKKYGPEVQWTFDWSPEDWKKYLFTYYRLVEKVDREIGRVLDALDASGLAENTMVVFTSDHGEGCASHRLVVKLSPYEEALRVPLVIRYPGRVPAGKVVETQLASGLDVGPTILDYAGAEPLPQARGISLKEVISGDKEQLRDFIVSELHPDIFHPEREARILRTADCKYMFATGGERVEEALYDLRQDPGEMHNIVSRPESRGVIREMRVRMGKWMRETDDPLLKPFSSLEMSST
jgi:arylsulfatase A-like enzyme